MLNAFIVDQLKKVEEQSWIDEQRPVLQIPCEQNDPPTKSKKSEEQRGVWTIEF